MTVIALCLAAAYSPVGASQEMKKEADHSCPSSDEAFPCPSAVPAKEIAETKNRQVANLTDGPQAQDQSNLPSSSSHLQDENSAVLFLPVKSSRSLSFGDKFTIYAHQTFGPPALILPAFKAGMGMANPTKHYPREWKDGAGAFGRLYGDSIAMVTSQRTARFLTGVAFMKIRGTCGPLVRILWCEPRTRLRLLSLIRPTPGETPLLSPVLQERLPAVLWEALICRMDTTISRTQNKEWPSSS